MLRLPPLSAAQRLQAFYRSLFERWLELVERTILDPWHSNPVAFGPGGLRLDSSKWVTGKIRNLRAEIEEGLQDRALQRELGVITERVTRHVGAQGSPRERRALARISVRNEVGAVAIERFRRQNIDRIKSLSADQLDRLETILEEAEGDGLRVEDLRKKIREEFDVAKSKADLIARDQTLKLAAKITQSRQRQAGVTHYTWSTSGDERVREDHADLDGEQFSWDDPPITNTRTGERNHPGEDFQCRCVAVPVLPDLNSEED